jgi:hypothetical protein
VCGDNAWRFFVPVLLMLATVSCGSSWDSMFIATGASKMMTLPGPTESHHPLADSFGNLRVVGASTREVQQGVLVLQRRPMWLRRGFVVPHRADPFLCSCNVCDG